MLVSHFGNLWKMRESTLVDRKKSLLVLLMSSKVLSELMPATMQNMKGRRIAQNR